MKIIKYLFFLGFITTGISSYTIYNFFNTPYVKQDTLFLVHKGSSFQKIVNDLANENLINSKYKDVFKYSSMLLYKNNIVIKAGEYNFNKNDTPYDIITKLEKGEIFLRKITFAEGLSVNSIVKIINSTPSLTGNLTNEVIKEGSLLPETYTYTYGDTKQDIIDRMQKAMTNFLDKEWENRDKNLPFTTKEEAISLASIVEKETGVAHERGMVASVFVNRLKKRMRLQSDPTVVYAFTKGDTDLEREIRKSDLARMSEYNTYRINGIPEHPIANPGKDAIKAVLQPEDTNYLYFVATGTGGHNFSTNLDQHNTYVREYRELIKEEW